MGKVLVAVSGGVDSVVLLDRLIKQGRDVGVAHVHHGLREASDEEYEFVAGLAAAYHVPFHGERLVFPDGGSQATYRNERYRFFENVMTEFNYDQLATAHHADDELETVLIQLHRNVMEVKGIPERRSFGPGILIRPLLNETKQQLLRYAQIHDLEWREDVTNLERAYLRNRIRHDIVPQLLRDWPNVVSEVGLAAKQQRQDWVERYRVCERWVDQYVECEMKAFHVKLKEYVRLNPIERYTVNRILSRRYGVEVGEAMERLSMSRKGVGTYDLAADWVMRKQNDKLMLEQQKKKVHEALVNQIADHFPATFVFGEYTFEVTVEDGETGIPFEDVKLPLTVRTLLPGDRMRLRVGTKKVSRIFIDNKIDRAIRPNVPLIVDATGKVIAIVGVRVSEFQDKSDAICPRLMVKW